MKLSRTMSWTQRQVLRWKSSRIWWMKWSSQLIRWWTIQAGTPPNLLSSLWRTECWLPVGCWQTVCNNLTIDWQTDRLQLAACRFWKILHATIIYVGSWWGWLVGWWLSPGRGPVFSHRHLSWSVCLGVVLCLVVCGLSFALSPLRRFSLGLPSWCCFCFGTASSLSSFCFGFDGAVFGIAYWFEAVGFGFSFLVWSFKRLTA